MSEPVWRIRYKTGETPFMYKLRLFMKHLKLLIPIIVVLYIPLALARCTVPDVAPAPYPCLIAVEPNKFISAVCD